MGGWVVVWGQMPRLLCSELSGDGLELVNMYFYDIRYESTTSHTNLPEVCSNLSTRNMRQTKNHFWPPAWDTRPVVPLSWSPQRWYNCEEELWLTCWLRWTPPVSRCRGGCWKTSLLRNPTGTERIKYSSIRESVKIMWRLSHFKFSYFEFLPYLSANHFCIFKLTYCNIWLQKVVKILWQCLKK